MVPEKPLQVLVAPLDWGLGHATRCIPIIKALLKRGNTVIIAATGRRKTLLAAEFPSVEIVTIPSFRVRLARHRRAFFLVLLLQWPRLRIVLAAEKRWIRRLCAERPIDLIVSDNRYGLYHPVVPAVFITHQLSLSAGPQHWIYRRLLRWHLARIEKFSACWVPDTRRLAGSLAGNLSHPPVMPKIPVHYVGWLSRFPPGGLPVTNPLLFLLSGPEPQRSLFEAIVFHTLHDYPGSAVVVRGLPGAAAIPSPATGVSIFSHLPAASLAILMAGSELIVCRSGYSTLMDLMRLGKRAVLVPTPGQPEQEYLARFMMDSGRMPWIAQQKFSLAAALRLLEDQPPLPTHGADFFSGEIPGTILPWTWGNQITERS